MQNPDDTTAGTTVIRVEGLEKFESMIQKLDEINATLSRLIDAINRSTNFS